MSVDHFWGADIKSKAEDGAARGGGHPDATIAPIFNSNEAVESCQDV